VVLLRFWRLDVPNEKVFDEVYYPKWAAEYLQGQTPYDVHPPLVKLLIAGSEIFLGDTTLAWRIIPAIFGSIIVILTYLVAKQLFKDKIIAMFSAFLIAFDGLFFVLSRIAIMEVFVMFFGILSIFCFWQYANSEKRNLGWLIATGFSLGFAISCKWTGLAIWLLLIVWTFFRWKDFNQNNKINTYFFVFNFIVIPLIIYLGSFLLWYHGTIQFWPKLIKWHQDAFNFHANLAATHPYSSRWWSWPLLVRPVWFYYQSQNNMVYGIIALGNPMIWWLGLVSLFWSAWYFIKSKIKNEALLFCFFGFLFTYLPWMFVKRIEFNYYYLPCLFFEILILSFFLKYFFDKNKKIVIGYLFLILIVFLFFYPILSNLPITNSFYNIHIWFKNWI
jgi:dolichyl-phosphate-mannose--protein O-mannosyl transferase